MPIQTAYPADLFLVTVLMMVLMTVLVTVLVTATRLAIGLNRRAC